MRRSPVSIWISMLPIANIQSLVWNAMLAQSECPTSLYMVSSKLCTVGKAETTSQWPGSAKPPPHGLQSRECGRLLAFATLWTCRVCPLPLANAMTLPTISITGFLAVSIPKRR